MNLRLMGSTDLVNEWAAIFKVLGLSTRIYPQRQGTGSRLYAEIDDRQAASLAKQVRSAKPPGKKAALLGDTGR